MARYTSPTAVHLFFLQGDQVLLLRRYQTGWEDGNYSVPAGHVEAGEEVRQAVIREAKEEAGIALRPEQVEPVGVMHRRATSNGITYETRVDFFFACRSWQGEIVNAEPEKCDELAFYPMENLPPNVIPYVRRALENLRAGRWFDSHGFDAGINQ